MNLRDDPEYRGFMRGYLSGIAIGLALGVLILAPLIDVLSGD